MFSSILKWFAALGTGALTAALAYVGQAAGTAPDVDPLVAGVLVGAVTKLVAWLTSKIPSPEA
jgi:predicted RNA methylase